MDAQEFNRCLEMWRGNISKIFICELYSGERFRVTILNQKGVKTSLGREHSREQIVRIWMCSSLREAQQVLEHKV